MKAILILATLLTMNFHVSAQTLEEIAPKINRTLPTPELMAVRAQLERLCHTSPDGWLPYYYMAYADIELSFRMEEVNRKMQYLNEAQTYLNRIDGGDVSETETLQGYRYFALMAVDPRTNGPKYAMDIISCYEKALKADPGNPRAVLLNALFRDGMARSMGSRYKDFQTDMARAAGLLESQDSTSLLPVWGGYYLKSE